MKERLPFRRAIETSRSDEEANDGGGGPSTGEGIIRIGSEVETFGQ